MNTDFRGPSPSRYLRDWLAPMLFALLVSATIRYHSLAAMQTMPQMVADLLGLAGVVLMVLLALGRRAAVSRGVALLLMGLGAAVAVSVLGSGGIDTSLLRLELYLAMALLVTVFYLTYRDAGTLPVAGYFLAIAVVHLPFLFAAVLWIKDLQPPFWQDSLRVAHFANVRQFAEFGFFAAVSATGLGLLSRRLVVPSFLLAAAALFGLVLTGSRGATLCWVLFVLLTCCFSQARLRAAVLGVGTLALSAGLVWYLDHSGVLLSPNIFSRVVQVVRSDGADFDSGRIALWIGSLRQIAAHPLFGSGPEGYWLSGCCDRAVLQAHNFILQFLLEFGLVGCTLVLVLVVAVIRGVGGFAGLRQLAVASPDNRVLGCLLAAYLAYSLIDQMMYHLLPLLFFALFAGLFAAGLAQARSRTTAPG
jgi:O-antigen ligase